MNVYNVRLGHRRRYRLWFVAVFCCLLLSGCKVELFSELDERNANDVLLVLNRGGISADKTQVEPGKWQILVQRDSIQAALATVQRHNLPRQQFVSLGDVFAKEGLIATPAEERQRYAFAVSQELSKTLMQIDGVVVARVHPVIPVIDPLSDRVPTPSAAVFIKHLDDADLMSMVPAIKQLVAQSIEGLDSSNVALTFAVASSVRMELKQDAVDADGIVASNLVVSGGLALAALVCWPISRLNLRAKNTLCKSDSALRRHPLVESIALWPGLFRTTKKKLPNENEDDGWHS